jgi:adenosylcobalamin-dependent ribonucleoside-triphosphate reductase
MEVDYRNQPIVIPVIRRDHPDVLKGEVASPHDETSARLLYKNHLIKTFMVPDSREGWAKAIEKIELLTFQKSHRDEVLLLDFSNVRPKGSAIHGMQDRPAAGPAPLMMAIEKIANLREAQMLPWRSTMFVDHYLAECVLVGGARRAARMATKTWRDETVFDFINIKKGGELWSSNNSVTVDAEFWKYVTDPSIDTPIAKHARLVFNEITMAAYYDHTGEPGLINQDKLTQNDSGFDGYLDGKFAESKKYQLDLESLNLTARLAESAKKMRFHQITNPCGEITLNLLGGYCVLGDVVPYHAKSDEEALDAFRATTRALLRVNLMDNMYKKEVSRTNRIGVGITGIHEWAWKRFGYSWKEIIDEEKSMPMWQMLSSFKRAVVEEARHYSKKLGQNTPHTNTTIKPAGTTSKLFGLTEGAHLPSMREFLRWVQFRSDDPQVFEYKKRGYPTRELKSYSYTTIVGFPTQPEICKLGMKDRLVTAAEATPNEQYQYLKLLEKYWIRGIEADGETPMAESGNQVSYTLKYDPQKVDYANFCQTLSTGQSKIRCCSVMPFIDSSAYEYQPEEAISKDKFLDLIEKIDALGENQEDVSQEHIDCITSACPIDFKIKV